MDLMLQSLSLPSVCPTMHCSRRCLVPARFWLPDCLLPSASIASAMPALPNSSSMPASPSPGAQRKQVLGPLENGLSDVPTTDLRRMGRQHHPPFFLGERLLPAPTQ